ncbi:hypothetical protein L1987_12478 [Smallanthus sonchifolius]|uniref:Uncharacterized protein n=1 Tax=Smallanthus sonchifolius TaxID=185202 RepID=A0ACB9JDV0_9ASTR|nr:hypothetical protein L1987_12478 [Smallanthus sonchifolius]
MLAGTTAMGLRITAKTVVLVSTCGLCGFDAHLSCATTSKPQESNLFLFLNQINQRDQILQAVMMAYGGNNVNNRLLQQMNIGDGNMNNQILQAILGGGGGGGSYQLLQTLMGDGGGGGGDLIQGLLGGSNGGLGGLDLSSVLGNVGDFGGLLGGFGF